MHGRLRRPDPAARAAHGLSPVTARRSRPARIVVVGTSGCGKTTFAAALAERLGVAHVELDALYWGPQWTPRPASDFEAAVQAATAGDAWVVDGNYSAVRERVWRRADTLFWLDFSFPRVYGRALRRTLWRVASRQELFSGNRESLRSLLDPEGVPNWVLRSFWRRRRELPCLLGEARFAHLEPHRFRRPAEAERFLASLAP